MNSLFEGDEPYELLFILFVYNVHVKLPSEMLAYVQSGTTKMFN